MYVWCRTIVLFYVWLMITAMIDASWRWRIYSITMPRVSFARSRIDLVFILFFLIQIRRRVLHATICFNYTNSRVLLLFFFETFESVVAKVLLLRFTFQTGKNCRYPCLPRVIHIPSTVDSLFLSRANSFIIYIRRIVHFTILKVFLTEFVKYNFHYE